MPSQIVEDELYTRRIDEFKIKWKRLDAAMTTIQPALLNSPELFPIVPGTRLRRLKLVGFPRVPPLSIFFIIDADRIILKTAELLDIEP